MFDAGLVLVLLIGIASVGVGHVAADDEAFFDVEVVGTNAPVTEGETLVVTAEVKNVGSAEDSQQIHLKGPDAEILDSVADPPLTLAPGQSARVTLEWTPEEGDAGTGEFSVQSDDDYPRVAIEIRQDTSGGDETEGENSSGEDETATVDGPDPPAIEATPEPSGSANDTGANTTGAATPTTPETPTATSEPGTATPTAAADAPNPTAEPTASTEEAVRAETDDGDGSGLGIAVGIVALLGVGLVTVRLWRNN